MNNASFASQLGQFVNDLNKRQKALFTNVVSHVETSIKVGSATTGAPGQPVDTGNLLNSWHTEIISADEAEISTNVAYAPVIEDNERGAQVRSAVGGFHSVKLTRAGFPAIVVEENEKLK